MNTLRPLEGQTDGKMEGEVATDSGVDDGIVGGTLVLIGGIDCLHTEIEAKDEEVEIETKTQSIGHRHLLEDIGEAELSAGLVGIVAQCPDVARIDKQGSGEFPKQLCPIFEVEVEFHVARLVDEVDLTVFACKASGTESSHRPASHTVGSSREISLLEGQDGAVAVGIGNA